MATMETVVEIKRPDYGTIVHVHADGSQKEWAGIRAGLSLPTEESNGYFIILGEEWIGAVTRFEGQEPKRGKIRLLWEEEIKSPFLNDTLRPFTDQCSLFGCREAYTGFEKNKTDEEIDQQVLLAREYLYDQHTNVNLYSAPYFKDFKAGVDIIRSFLDKALLDLPKDSLANQQLANLAQPDLKETPEMKFVAINGLRFVVASFHKSPPRPGKPWVSRRNIIKPYRISRPHF
jgi:hypothetical protein